MTEADLLRRCPAAGGCAGGGAIVRRRQQRRQQRGSGSGSCKGRRDKEQTGGRGTGTAGIYSRVPGMAGVAAGGSMASEWVLGAPAAMVVNKQAVVAATVAANAGVQHCNRARARVVSQFAPPDVCDPLVGSCQIMEPDGDHVGQSRSSRAVGGRGQLLPTLHLWPCTYPSLNTSPFDAAFLYRASAVSLSGGRGFCWSTRLQKNDYETANHVPGSAVEHRRLVHAPLLSSACTKPTHVLTCQSS
jgi:hypothetical protein